MRDRLDVLNVSFNLHYIFRFTGTTMTLFLKLKDHDGKVYNTFTFLFGQETTLIALRQKIESVFNIEIGYQVLFYQNGDILEQTLDKTLESVNLKNGDQIIIKHSELDAWLEFLSLCADINNRSESKDGRKMKAERALAIADILDRSKLDLAYRSYCKIFADKRVEAMTAIDPLPSALKKSARDFFAMNEPEALVEFESKSDGIMSGVIVKLIKGDVITRFHLKTYHGSSGSAPPNLIELFVYRLLSYLNSGPIVFFPFYKKSDSNLIHFIMTKEVPNFIVMENITDEDLKVKLVVEVYMLRLILGIGDLNSANFGSDDNNELSIVDFSPPRGGDNFQQTDIAREFKTGNKLDHFPVTQVLEKVAVEKRVAIGRMAVDRWSVLTTVTTSIIDTEKTILRSHGTEAVEKYLVDIKKNYEALSAGLQ